MNDNDIIKALKCCRIGKRENDCKKCPLYGRVPACVGHLTEAALDLINRQKAEIEEQDQAIINALNRMREIRAEAFRVLAERLRNKFFNYYDGLHENTSKSNHNGDSLMFYEVADMIVDCIDTSVEEMMEGGYAPVAHGEWLETKDRNKKKCSRCRVIHLIAQYPAGNIDYCPNCGAKIDGGQG